MAKVTVRVTMFADPIEVDEDEIPGLRMQGLLIEDPAADLQRARDAVAAELDRLDGQIAASAPKTPAKAAKTTTAKETS